MPLPTSDAITFRDSPSLGDKATIALSLTLSNTQVKALFARHEAINKLTSDSATQFPLEIDFDNKKFHIGDTTTSFKSAKETGIREVCRRTPSIAKPLAGLFRSAAVVGKLTILRKLDDAASNLRKATEAEQAKKNGRGIVRINAPLPAPKPKPKGKKSKPSGAVSLIKKAAANKAVSSQADFTTPVSTNSPKLSSSRPSPPKPSSSRPSPSSTTLPIPSTSTRDPDVNSLRSRLIHFIAASARPKEVAISQFISANRGRTADNEADVRTLFDQVAQEIPGPRNSDPNHWIWDLRSCAWLEVKPSNDTPDQASRRTRIGLAGLSFRRHSSTRIDSDALASISVQVITPAGTGGGVHSNVKGKEAVAKPSIPDLKVASTSKRRLKDEDDLKPRRLPAAETKRKAEVESSLTPTSSTVLSTLKPSKKAPSRKEPSPKPPVLANNPTQKRRLSDLESEPSSELEEGEIRSKELKKRRIIGSPKASKPNPIKKVDNSGVSQKPSVINKGILGPSTLNHNQGSQETKTKITASSPEVDVTKGKGGGPPRINKACSIDDKGKGVVEHERERPTPSFSSDKEQDETQRVAEIPTGRLSLTTSSAPKANDSKEREFGSATLPEGKEGLSREYGMNYAHYLHTLSKCYAQKAKVESALALDDDASLAEEDSDLMESEELVELCDKFYGIRNELERIRKAHRNLNKSAF